MTRPAVTPRIVVALVTALAAAACATGPRTAPVSAVAASWEEIVEAADGQTVRWWMYGGDERVNRYVDAHVAPAAARHGVTLRRVPVQDTADAVQRLVAEAQAGVGAGAVDLLWVNGENFALGKREGLWLEGWAQRLPNRRFVDAATVQEDFGVPVDGQESPWSRALFVFAHDTARVASPPASLAELLAFARENPGRFTYPAPPDFTGSAFVRQVVAVLGEARGFDYLRQLQPLLWRRGRVHPGSEAELNALFGDGEVDFAMSYDPAFVHSGVRQGVFPPTARPFVLDHGTLHNVSYVTIPANARHREGALVVADLLLSPALQAAKADPAVLGLPTVLDLDRLDPRDRQRFRHARSPYLLDDPGVLVGELPVSEVERLERRWRAQVLR